MNHNDQIKIQKNNALQIHQTFHLFMYWDNLIFLGNAKIAYINYS